MADVCSYALWSIGDIPDTDYFFPGLLETLSCSDVGCPSHPVFLADPRNATNVAFVVIGSPLCNKSYRDGAGHEGCPDRNPI